VAQKANLSFKNRFPYISVTDEASDFKSGLQLGFAKAHHEIPLEEKSVALGYGSSPKFGASPIIFQQRLGLATSNLTRSWVCQGPSLITRRRKGVHGLGLGKLPKIWGSPSLFTQWLKLGTSNLVHSLGFPRATIKPLPEEKWEWPWVREAPKYFRFPFNISATAALSS